MQLSVYEIKQLNEFYQWVDHTRRELKNPDYVANENVALFSEVAYPKYKALQQHLTGNVIRRIYNNFSYRLKERIGSQDEPVSPPKNSE